MSTATASKPYTIISSDCHAGGNHAQYREYLDPAYVERFDAWRGAYRNPFRDLQDDTRSRNWDDDRRIGDLGADGIVGEVVFPNTVPPFFPTGVVIAQAPTTREDYELRLAGIRAHNRWLADFVAAHPTRRCGLGQILLNDVDEALADVRWMAEHGLGGVLLPGVAPNTGIEPLYSPVYDPLWALCCELGLPVTHHGGGSGMPDFGDHPASTVIYMMEAGFFANRAFWHLVFSGVFERFDELVFVMTEQGASWLPEALERMDALATAMAAGKFGELGPGAATMRRLPSEQFATNCYVGTSFPSPHEAEAIRSLDPSRFMWGSDYPHREGTFPYTRESLRRSFSDWEPDTLRDVFGRTAAKVYGFDLAACDALAAEVGPSPELVATPLDVIPPDASSPAFTRR